MTRSLKPTTLAFLLTLGMTLLIWVLRGARVLSFIEGWVLWVLIFLCIILAVISNLR